MHFICYTNIRSTVFDSESSSVNVVVYSTVHVHT